MIAVMAAIAVAVVVGLGLGAVPPQLPALASAAGVTRPRSNVLAVQNTDPKEAVTLARGIYFGWVAGAASRFLLAGASCGGGAHPQVAELYGGDLLPSRVLPSSAVSSFRAPLNGGRELLVTALSSTALAGLFAEGDIDADESHEVTAATTERLTFSGLRARCRTWQETDSELGSAGVLLLPAIRYPESPPEPAARAVPLHNTEMHEGRAAALEAHVLPVPDRTALLALMLLWNRTAETVVVDAIHYAPDNAASDSVIGVAGAFDDYNRLAARVLGATTGSTSFALWRSSASRASWRRSSFALDLELGPGGIALIGIDQGSFTTTRRRAADSAQLVYLGYPVIDYRPQATAAADLPANLRPESGRAPKADSGMRLAMTSPLYARW